MPRTFSTAVSAVGLLPLTAELATEFSALAMVIPTLLAASILAEETVDNTSKAADWLATDSDTLGAALTTARTNDAAAEAEAGVSVVLVVPTMSELSSCV